jgi:methionyl-tRNA formyltransferase
MLVEKKVDSGPILSQRTLTVDDGDTTATLSEKLSLLGAEMLVETIPDWVAGKIRMVTQEESQASYTKMESRKDGRLVWKLPAIELWRMVRAYQPWPGCFTTWNNTRLKVITALPIADTSSGRTGEVLALPRTAPARLAVRTGNGLLGLITVQFEGKREMSAVDFMAGHRDFIGAIL